MENKIKSVVSETINSDAPTFAKNKVELARVLGVSRNCIHAWITLPGFPRAASNGKWDIIATKEYVRVNNLKGGEASDMAKEKFMLVRAHRKKLEFDLEIKKGLYVNMAELSAMASGAFGTMRAILRQKFENEFPAIVLGLDAPGIRIKAEQAIDQALRSVGAHLDALGVAWDKKHPEHDTTSAKAAPTAPVS